MPMIGFSRRKLRRTFARIPAFAKRSQSSP